MKRKIWRERARVWDKFIHPARPSKLNLKVYERYISRIAKDENPKVLVLGSTPEIRNLTAKYQVQTTVVDISRDAYEGLTLLMKRKGEERFIHCDWLEMPTRIKHDLVIGDTAINMLAWEEFERYLIKIKNVLKSNGFYVERIPVRKKKTLTKKEFVNVIKGLRKWCHEERIGAPGLFHLWCYATKDGKEYFCLKDQIKKLEVLYEEGYLTKKEWKSFQLFKIDLKFCFPNRDEFEKLAKKHFSIQEVIRCNDPESRDFSPIYVMAKRGDVNGS